MVESQKEDFIMNPVKLIADSSCDIGPELAKRYDVDFAHIHVRLSGKDHLDGVDITHKEIYENYEKNHTLPSTCAMNIDEYESIFAQYIEKGFDVVHVSLGSGLSSTCNNARLAGEKFGEGRVYVIDSKSLSSGSGHIVCECGERIKKGLSAKQVYEEVVPIADRVSASFILDDLKYLHAGGRCSGLAQFGASLMNIKPCIMVRNDLFGSMTVGKKYMGSYKRSALKYVENMIKDRTDIALDRCFITHSGSDPEVLEAMKKLAAELQPFKEIFITQASATICSHCGPNTTGILFITK